MAPMTSPPALTVTTLPTFPLAEARRLVEAALAEDLGWGDVTTEAVVGAGRPARGDLVVKAAGVITGLPVAALVCTTVDPAIAVTPLVADGTSVTPGTTVAQVRGPAGSLLRAERVALNFLQRLSGIATLTARYVAAIVAAMKKNGVPVEYVVFPDEGHGFIKKENEIRGYGAVLAFLDQHLKGVAPAGGVAAN